MTEIFNKFKIPTFLGLGIIFLGIASGVYLILQEQTFLSRATPNLAARNITLTNISEESVVISWQTNSPAVSFITFGQNSLGEQTALDDRDSNQSTGSPREAGGPKSQLIHYVTLKNLLPKTSYQFKIISGKITSDVQKFETATPLTNQTIFPPIIGSVLDGNTPLESGVVYFSITKASTQSSLIKEGGNFLIPLSQIRKDDLSDAYQLTEEMIAKLTINSDKGNASILFRLNANPEPLPPIKLGQNIDLTVAKEDLQPTPTAKDLYKYDLNGDSKINAADNAIILQNFGPLREASKNPKDKKADLNGDGIVNQKDLDLMSQKLKELGSQ